MRNYSLLRFLWRTSDVASLPAQLVFLGKEQDVIIELQGIEHTQVDAMETVGSPFSTLFKVTSEQGALSATCAIERLRRRRASLICSPTIAIFCTSFLGSLVPIVFFVILYNLKYNLQSYKNNSFNNVLHRNIMDY